MAAPGRNDPDNDGDTDPDFDDDGYPTGPFPFVIKDPETDWQVPNPAPTGY